MKNYRNYVASILALALTTPLAERRVAAQSPSCSITQITFTTGGNSFNNSTYGPPPISDDGTRIAFPFDRDLTGGNPDGRHEIFLYDSTTGGITQVTSLGGSFFPSISGDGTQIAFASGSDPTGGNADHNGEIFLYDVTAGGFTQVTNTTGGIFPNLFPSISGDGTRIAFPSEGDLTGGNPDGNFEVFLYDSTTGSIVQVTDTIGMVNGSPAISSDGTRVAFNSRSDLTGENPDGNSEGFLYDIQTSSFAQVTDSTEGFTAIGAMDGDGTRLALRSDQDLTGGNSDGNVEVFFYDATTGTFTQVTDSMTLNGSGPSSISDDGARIALVSSADFTGGNADGNGEIFLYDAWSGRITQVTDTTGTFLFGTTGASLNGDGTRLAFASKWDLTGGNPDGNSELFSATCTRDSDEDGIPDESDPDTVADVVTALPDTAFNSGGNRNALLNRLDAIEKLILAGNTDQAIDELQNLRRHVDGCGAAADNNDWITNCAAQQQVRALIDMLIANL